MADVFIVDDDLDFATPDDIRRLENSIGSALPQNYTRFLTSFGEGTYGDHIWVKGIDRVLNDRSWFANLVRRDGDFWWPGSETILSRSAAVHGLSVALSDDGDELFLDLASQRLFVLPRHHECLFEVIGGFDEPLSWPTDYRGASPLRPTFVPTHNLVSAEMFPRGEVPSLIEQENAFSAVLSGKPDDYVRRQDGQVVVIHSRYSRVRLQLSGRVRLNYNKNFPELAITAIALGKKMGFDLIDVVA